MKPAKTLVSRFTRLLTATAVIFVFSIPAFAYEEDTHFVMTYVICRSVGFTPDEALVVASVDQGMDDSDGTSPLKSVEAQWRWHALNGYAPDGYRMGAARIIRRRDELFKVALVEASLQNKLIRLGVFFHFQQDTWSHRAHYNGLNYFANRLAENSYIPFETPLGHGLSAHKPDRPPYDPVTAVKSLENGIIFARQFLKEALHREPNKFFADYYVSQGGKDDEGWNDDRKGVFFHQIDLSGAAPGSARLYLLSLIRAQIDAYGKSAGTADEASLEKVKAGLVGVIQRFKDQFGSEITFRSKSSKYKNLTNAMLTSKLHSAPQFIGAGVDFLLQQKANLDARWVKANKHKEVIAVTAMGDGTILGVGTDNALYKRVGPVWTLVSSQLKYKNITTMPDGRTLMAVSTDNKVFTLSDGKNKKVGKPPLDKIWVEIGNSENIISVAVMHDNTVLAVGTDNGLYKISMDNAFTFNSQREPIPTEVKMNDSVSIRTAFMGIAVMQDGTILGIGVNKSLFKRANLDRRIDWEEVQNPGQITSIAEVPLV